MARPDPPEIDHPYVFSVSQVETFLLCPRKWAHQKIDGQEDLGSASTVLGGKVHDVLENYLKRGIPINPKTEPGQIALPAVAHLPPPMFKGMRIEEWFAVPIGNAVFRGLKDVEIPRGWKSWRPFVSDHKTTKSFGWAKTAEKLQSDIQAGIYSYDTYVNTKKEEIDLQWTYMKTTGARAAEPTRTIIRLPQIMRVVEKVSDVADQMIATKLKHKTAMTVEYNAKGCDAFGGCTFVELCKLTPRERMLSIMSQAKKQEGILGNLARRRKEKAAAGGGKPAVGVNPPEKEEPEEVEGEEEAEAAPVVNRKAKPATTPKAKPKAEGKPTKVSTEGAIEGAPSGALVRACQAFWDVLADDIANRVAAKLK